MMTLRIGSTMDYWIIGLYDAFPEQIVSKGAGKIMVYYISGSLTIMLTYK